MHPSCDKNATLLFWCNPTPLQHSLRSNPVIGYPPADSAESKGSYGHSVLYRKLIARGKIGRLMSCQLIKCEED